MQRKNTRTSVVKKINIKQTDVSRMLRNPLLICGSFLKIDNGKFFFYGIKQRRVKRGGKYEQNS